jgi:response regulator of citrate/malate metabolism
MEEKIIISRRFRNNTLGVYQYLLKEFSAKRPSTFLTVWKNELSLLPKTQQLVSSQLKERMCAVSYSHHTINFFTAIRIMPLKYFACLICVRIQRKNPISKRKKLPNPKETL